MNISKGSMDRENEEDQVFDHSHPQKFESLMEDLPEPQQKAVHALLFALSLKIEKTSWSGPLPPPAILQGYNDSIHDGAERIFRMAEGQSQYRMEMEKLVVQEEHHQVRTGQHFALVVALAFLFVSGTLIWYNHDVAGTVLGSIDLVALVSTFIFGKTQSRKVLES